MLTLSLKDTQKRKTIPYNFGEKHKDYIRRCHECTFNILEGAVRSGKTVDNIFAFAHELKSTPDKIHLATGSTMGNAKLNVGDANGFGLEWIFRGQCRWGRYHDLAALIVKGPATNFHEKVVIFAGGGQKDSYKKIRGNSYGMWIATEINLHHDNTIREAFNRQLAAKQRKIFWDLNPSNPNAPIYTDYIDRYRDRNREGTLLGGYNYAKMTIFDNINISQDRFDEIVSQYDPTSVWYRRDILGERCVAEGLIYQQFADNPKPYLIDNVKEWLRTHGKKLSLIMIGVDFGGTRSASKFQATGITSDGTVIALDELYIEHRNQSIDPDGLNRRFAEFVRHIGANYGTAQTRADSAEQILIRGLQKTAQCERLPTQVKNAMKLPINDRIKLELLLMTQKRLFISQQCPHLIDAFCTAAYDSTKHTDERLDNGTSDIDSLDAFEYSIEPHFKALELAGHKQ